MKQTEFQKNLDKLNKVIKDMEQVEFYYMKDEIYGDRIIYVDLSVKSFDYMYQQEKVKAYFLLKCGESLTSEELLIKLQTITNIQNGIEAIDSYIKGDLYEIVIKELKNKKEEKYILDFKNALQKRLPVDIGYDLDAFKDLYDVCIFNKNIECNEVCIKYNKKYFYIEYTYADFLKMLIDSKVNTFEELKLWVETLVFDNYSYTWSDMDPNKK